MKLTLTAILIATRFGASKATVVDHTDGGGVSQDFAVFDVNKPDLASVVDAEGPANANPFYSFEWLEAKNGNDGYCLPWGKQGGELCKEEKTLSVCTGYDGSYYLPSMSYAEVASKCLEEPKCKGFTWDPTRNKGKLKSRIDSVDGSNSRWSCFKKKEGAVKACPQYYNNHKKQCSVNASCNCYKPRELRINRPQKGVNCYACVIPNYVPASILQCKYPSDCDTNNSECAIVRADFNGPGNDLSNTETMCIPNAGAAIGKPCFTNQLCASGSCMYVDGNSQKGKCIQGGVHSEEE